MYWERRRRNNALAKAAREKKRGEEQQAESVLARLMAEREALKDQVGMLCEQMTLLQELL